MSRQAIGWVLVLVALAAQFEVRPARGQGPTIVPPTAAPGGEASSLGLAPGSGGNPGRDVPPGEESVLSGRVGPSVPRVESSITRPGQRAFGIPEEGGITLPPALPIAETPLYGPLALPARRDDDGPPGGLTLDQAIERLVHQNVALRARFLEIPQAEADVLTASLRANPVLYADSQLIPYGQYSIARPGGPLQYDVNITYPLDVTHKRHARTAVSARAVCVLQAQYQDAVRLQIDNLYTAYVDVLAARETVRYARASREGLGYLFSITQTMKEKGSRTIADVNRVRSQREAAEVGLMDAEELLRRTQRTLGRLLAIPPAEAETLELYGTIRDRAPPPPPIDTLTTIALNARPDLAAYRLGVHRAEADVALARANRYPDVYLLYQPYTFQNNAPFDRRSATSWALGATVPLPIYNRNQGNIQRAQINVTQSNLELTDQEQQVVLEVRQAEREYAISRAAVERIEGELLPSARQVRDATYQLYVQGEQDIVIYLNAQRDYNETVRQYRDTVVRHRRSMLRLNTVVGERILP